MKKLVSIIVGLLMVKLSFGQTQNNKDFDKPLMAQLDTIHKIRPTLPAANERNRKEIWSSI